MCICHLQKYCTAFEVRYLIGQNHDTMRMKVGYKQFRHLQKYCTPFKVCHLIGRNHDAIYAKTKFIHSSLEYDQSDPLCDSVNRGLTLVRLIFVCYN